MTEVDDLVQNVEKYYQEMLEKGMLPPASISSLLLAYYCNANLIQSVETCWQTILNYNLPINVDMLNILMNFYAHYADQDNVDQLFRFMTEKKRLEPTDNTFTEMVRCYLKMNRFDLVAELWEDMERVRIPPAQAAFALVIDDLVAGGRYEGAEEYFAILQSIIPPEEMDPSLYVAVLNAYIEDKKYEDGEKLWKSAIVPHRKHINEELYCCMFRLYGKWRNEAKLESMCEEMRNHPIDITPITFNSMVEAYADMDDVEKMNSSWNSLKQAGIQPSVKAYLAMLKHHSRLGDIDNTKRLFDLCKHVYEHVDRGMYTGLLNAYVVAWQVQGAESCWHDIIRELGRPEVEHFEVIMTLHRNRGDITGAINRVQEMKVYQLEPSGTVYASLLRTFIAAKQPAQGLEYWRLLNQSLNSDDLFVALFDVYIALGDLSAALLFLRQSHSKLSTFPSMKDIYCRLLQAFIDRRDKVAARNCWQQMILAHIEPYEETFSHLLMMHMMDKDDAMNHINSSNNIDEVDDKTTHQSSVFHQYLQYLQRRALRMTLSTYNPLLEIASLRADTALAEEIIKEIISGNLVPNEKSFSTLIKVFANAGNLLGAWRYVTSMRKHGFRLTVGTYKSLVTACFADQNKVMAGQCKVLAAEDGVQPDPATLVLLKKLDL